MKKDIWVVVIVLCILGILAVIYKVWKDGKDGLLEKFFNDNNRMIENYNNQVIENYNNPVLQNNIISNGSFNEGKAPIQYTGSHGNAEIIVFPNNGQSSYVLRQSSLKTLKPDDPIYYRMDVLLKPNAIYYLGCLYFSTRNTPLKSLIIFNKTTKVMVKSIEETQYEYTKAGDFKYRYSLFKTPSDSDQVRASIYLSFNYNNMPGFNYITDIGLFELLNNNVIPVWDDLRSYFNPFNTESIEPRHSDLRDISFHGFDFQSKLANNVTKGRIILTENRLTGPNAFKLQNQGILNLTNNFSFIIFVKGANVQSKSSVETFQNARAEETMDPKTMTLSQYQRLWNSIGCQSILSEGSISWWKTQNYSTVLKDMRNYFALASQCKGTDKQNSICLPGKCAATGNRGEGSQSESAMSDTLLRQPAKVITTVSPNEMNKVIADIDGITLINFPGNQGIAVAVIVPKTYGPIRIVVGGSIYETAISHANFMDLLLTLVYNGDFLTVYLDGEPIMETVCPKIYYDNNSVIINPQEKFSGDLFAFAYYNRALNPQQVKTVSSYFNKMRSVGSEITTISSKMVNFVNSFIIKDEGFVADEESMTPTQRRLANLSPKEREKKLKEIRQEEEEVIRKKILENRCPQVRFEDGHYYVIIPPKTKLADDLGYSGLRDYGTNIDTAKQIFETNFPQCPVPDVLDKRKYKGELEKCPFVVINDENPCKKFDCQGTDWTKGNSNNPNCKKAIDSYCTKYHAVDNACYCWKPENKNKPACMKWRGQFDNPDKCDFRKYPVEAHPDANKYIRKDKIPCWGCNLSDEKKCS